MTTQRRYWLRAPATPDRAHVGNLLVNRVKQTPLVAKLDNITIYISSLIVPKLGPIASSGVTSSEKRCCLLSPFQPANSLYFVQFCPKEGVTRLP